ncbi:MAG: sugar ABC transporter ATP-binding protein [Suipraeoptans sp.]
MKHIYKSFNTVQVLKDVSLKLEPGEVHALLGENGAGKSTLMNILAGVYPRDTGSVFIDGKETSHVSIKEAEKSGIAFVHQELNLFNDLKVFENIFLDREYTNALGKLNKKKMIETTRSLFEELGVLIDPTESVGNLKTSEKQLLEISKALFFKAKLLILDEPTTALGNDEIDHLFDIIRKRKQKGTSFIFISHKMPEIFKIADNYTILRNGELISTGRVEDTTPEDVTKAMVGESYKNQDIYKIRSLSDTVFEIRNLSGDGFHDVNLSIKKGQIVGITGLQGSGSSELLQCMFGATRSASGEIYIHGKKIKHESIHNAMKHKVAMLPSNRKETSVIPDMSLLDNTCLSEHTLSSLRMHIHKRREVKNFMEYKKLLNIKAEKCSEKITSLSGGNQQKVFLARWLNTGADILLLDNPTQGIDVGAKQEIYKLILELADKGKTILFNSLEIPEMQKIADVCHIFYNGTIIKTLEHNKIDEKTVMLYSTNAIEKQGGNYSEKQYI